MVGYLLQHCTKCILVQKEHTTLQIVSFCQKLRTNIEYFNAVKLNFLKLRQQARQFNTSHLCMDGTVANCGRVIYFQEQCGKKLKNILHIL